MSKNINISRKEDDFEKLVFTNIVYPKILTFPEKLRSFETTFKNMFLVIYPKIKKKTICFLLNWPKVQIRNIVNI